MDMLFFIRRSPKFNLTRNINYYSVLDVLERTDVYILAMFLIYSLVRSSRRAILLNYVFFFSGATFLKRFLEHIKCTRRTKNIKRTHQNFQESFLKILQEHIQFSRRRKYIIKTDQLFQNFVRTHKIFQEKEIP